MFSLWKVKEIMSLLWRKGIGEKETWEEKLTMYTIPGVMPGKFQNAVLKLSSIIFLYAVSKLKPKQYKLSWKWHQSNQKFL